MAGHPLIMNGREIIYLAAGEDVPAELLPDLELFDTFDDRELQVRDDVRRVLTPLLHPRPLFYNVLHWSDGTDLEALDRKVEQGEATEEDFAGALQAEPRDIWCRNCGAQVRLLVIQTAPVLFSSAAIAERLKTHKRKERCPACDEHLNMLVVDFLGESLGPAG